MSTPTLLHQLRQMSGIVLETANPETARKFEATHVDLSTARIVSAAQLPEHEAVVDAAVIRAQREMGKGGNRKLAAIRAVERLPVEFGLRLLEVVPGRISVEIDARLAYNTGALVDRAQALVRLFEKAGVARDRVMVKLPATWEAIRAADKLEKQGVHCHMTLVFGLHQLAASADAGATVVAPAVGRILDWHKKKAGGEASPEGDDPAVRAAANMHAYLKQHGYPTLLMPYAFRSETQVLGLAGCDLLSVPPPMLEALGGQVGDVPCAINPQSARGGAVPRIVSDAATFSAMHTSDELANSKLTHGISNLSWALVSQEKQLTDWILGRQDREARASAIALFKVWDYDGDGYIDREEWGGTEEVFNALDRDGNGRISVEEMALGLGAPIKADAG